MWRGEAGTLGRVVSVGLRPVGWLWRAVTWARNQWYDRAVPAGVTGLRVVSVGNLAVGGTGKTPIASWVAETLRVTGMRPAILHGGYGRDEALLHARWTPDVPVIVERHRRTGGQRALVAGCGAAILDDGFQHRRLPRDVDLVVLAAEDRFPGPLLPSGPYREPATSLTRADGVIISRRTASAPEASALAERVRALVPGVEVIASVQLRTTGLTRLAAPADVRVPEQADGSPVTIEAGGVLVVTAVARPDTVLETVAPLVDGEVELLAFADHHDYTEDDVREARRRAGDRLIVVTEKDAVKLERYAELLAPCSVTDQSLSWDWGEAEVRRLVVGAVSS